MRRFRIPPHLTVLTAAFATLFLLLFMLPFLTYPLRPHGTGEQVMLIRLPSGTTLTAIAHDLEGGQIIGSARAFTLYGRLRGAQTRLQAGTYQVSDGLPPAEILRRMMAGEVYAERFAVPEGYSIHQLAEMLRERKLLDPEDFLAACRDRTLLAEFGIAAASAEGYLFPSTYDLAPGSTAEAAVRPMLQKFRQVFDDRFAPRLAGQGLSRHQLVTLASLVEKEARVPEERPLIASVFHNRLRRGMPLQSDPTAVYGLRAFGGTVTASDVRRRTPYNTYVIRGLPPGPIGNPSAEALEAALNPASTPYLYFVARQDGTHFFSATLDEHNKGVTRYLRSGCSPAERRK
jgi:UPF0755 protein